MAAPQGKITWITGSLRERDAALDLLRGTEEAEPRDEFGVASLRDVLANAFFPGVTTLQTRAKYFLWVPAVYLELEHRRPSGGRVREAVRRHEHDLMMGLKVAGESDGVIGSRNWRLPQRSATGIYWHGTRSWNLRNFTNSQGAYHRWLASSARAKPPPLAEEQGEQHNWAEWLYEQDSLLRDHTPALSQDQGNFLVRRIETISDAPRRCLLKDLLDEALPRHAPFWEVETVRRGRTALSKLANYAGYLSAAMDGAIRAYGVLWAQLREDLEADDYRPGFEDWVTDHPPAYWREWDLEDFWTEIKCLPRGEIAEARTRSFITELVDRYRKQNRSRLLPALEAPLVRRERRTKSGRARLSGAAASRRGDPPRDGGLGFRWWQARRMLEDIRLRGDQ